MSTLIDIEEWHRRARPRPTPAQFSVQLGVHLEEVVEMLNTFVVGGEDNDAFLRAAAGNLHTLAERLKKGEATGHITHRKEFLEALADQIVTAVGAGYCAHMNVPIAAQLVDESNWSKYDALGAPLFDENGNVKKGPFYVPVKLEGLY